ncbi:hypothetical protein [Sphingobium sp. AntQ-1]|uniref:hypothetical protein n=1 Tax=Sphingobium sp. AntQ-1 TaxID=2930091 RepID=UPI00234EBC13|nr:hypothetical protein [Sphingobium sp. AntQ-1]
MTKNAATPDNGLFPLEDRMGFAVPVSPAHALLLLNSYMRTDLLLGIHGHVHQMRDQNAAGSPIHHLADSIVHVIAAYDGINLFECVARNTLHIDPDFEFCPESDYAHDIKLMKHHLRCLRRTIKDLARYD